MSLRYLVDTDWIIHYLNGHRAIVSQLQTLTDQGCAVSVVSLAELYEGVHYSSNPTDNAQALSDFLLGMTVLGIDTEICKIFGQHRGRLRATGKVLGDFDLLIGSTALRYELTVLTNNRRHFSLIDGLAIESQ